MECVSGWNEHVSTRKAGRTISPHMATVLMLASARSLPFVRAVLGRDIARYRGIPCIPTLSMNGHMMLSGTTDKPSANHFLRRPAVSNETLSFPLHDAVGAVCLPSWEV